VKQTSAENIGRHHTEQEQGDQRQQQTDPDQLFADQPLRDRPEPSIEETEDETREENRDHQREGHHEADQQPGADPASEAAPILLLPGEVAEAPEEAALLGWVVACHGRSL